MSPRLIKGYDPAGNEIWRDSTAEEDTNLAALITKANAALTNNQTFLAIATPTAAQVSAQTKALTRQTNAIIRLLMSQLADISDT